VNPFFRHHSPNAIACSFLLSSNGFALYHQCLAICFARSAAAFELLAVVYRREERSFPFSAKISAMAILTP
jgi:hypothetical protein